MIKTSCLLAMAVFLLALAPRATTAATMNDYCITPPYIVGGIKPNVLMVIDNSASMYDLAYADTGRKRCSTTATYCTSDAGCPSGETCTSFARQPYYCYDQTYTTGQTYVGYFDSSKLYKYVAGEFIADAAAFTCTAGAGETAKSIAGQLCVVYTTATPTLVTGKFRASGNYLNWLTASKFDVQKEILTGGKYDGTDLIAESRGCVGNSFVKEANTANFIPYNSPETNNTNVSLGVTFGVRGPFDSVNPSAPSPGGQTYLDIYLGNYNQGNCQDAVTAIVDGNNAEIKSTVESCLNYSAAGTQTAITKTKIVFQQSMQACWQYRSAGTVGHDDIVTVTGKCPEIYSGYATCSNDPKKVCTTATVATDCGAGAGITCNYGPGAIVPGNPALLCGNQYEGQYYYYQPASLAGSCSATGTACTVDGDCTNPVKQCKKTTNMCTSDADCPGAGNSCSKIVPNTCNTSPVPAAWLLMPTATEATMITTHNQFCSDMTATPAMDPTNSASDTSLYENVPAILSGAGVEAQLNQPIGTLTVKVNQTAAPKGVIQDYSNQIRLGAMTFNFSGSATEASATGAVKVPRLCSNDSTKVCTLNIDCVPGGTCDATTAGTTNLDGAQIIHYVGEGHCLTATGTVCYTAANCPANEECVSDGIGNYSSGLIKKINDIRAKSWTPFSEAFYNAIGYLAKDPDTGLSRTDLRLNSGDFDENRNPLEYRCQANDILLISDGMSTADRNVNVDNLAKLYTAAGGATSWTATCPSYAGSVNLDNMAWIARHRNIGTFSKTTASTEVPIEKGSFISTYVVYNGDSNGEAGECDSKTLLSQTAANGGTTLYQAIDPATLDTALRNAFSSITAGVSSGTAASILSNSEGSGANILQAVFYPKKYFSDNTEANWIGELQNLWYFVDPFIGNSTVREDSDYTVANRAANDPHSLNLVSDYVADFFFVSPETKVNLLRDTDGNGSGDTPISTVYPDEVKSIWRAGNQLWSRNLATNPRNIKTTISGSSLMDFSTANAVTLQPYLQAAASPSLEAEKIIKYAHGIDLAKLDTADTYYDPSYRVRTVTTRNFKTGATGTNVWKLGDIISSTPRLQSSVRQNAYNLAIPIGYGDASYDAYTRSAAYQGRGMAYVGANDGMLHAFNLGVLDVTATGNQKATLSGSGLGEEAWAFVPKGALPYLKYLADPSYNHLYQIDGTSVLVDMSICAPGACATSYWNEPKTSASWRTILIGGMGLGGASRITGAGCTDCVKTPRTDPVARVAAPAGAVGLGYSSYFALDVTNPNAPTLLWEFPNPLEAVAHAPDAGGVGYEPDKVGFATSGAAIVRTSSRDADGKPVHTNNGEWYAIFASGPTGPIDTGTNQFLGKSDQTLKIFVRDVKVPAYTQTIDTGIPNAFAATISGGVFDADRLDKTSKGFYQDDAVYIGYVRQCVAADTGCTVGTWTKGGVIRLIISDTYNPNFYPTFTGVSPTFKWSKVIDGIGPVTTGISRLQDKKNHKLWLYFGTGRYYYKLDDFSSTQRLYGIQEPCYKGTVTRPSGQTTYDDIDDLDTVCSAAPFSLSDLEDQTAGTSSTIAESSKGWYIDLEPVNSPTGFGAERVITDPVPMSNGVVYYTTFQPTGDVCSFGGNSYLWAVKYDTGYQAPANALHGKALIQVSTGSFEEIDLRHAFTAKEKRRLGSPMTGKPPGDPPPIVSKSGLKPVKKILQIKEK